MCVSSVHTFLRYNRFYFYWWGRGVTKGSQIPSTWARRKGPYGPKLVLYCYISSPLPLPHLISHIFATASVSQSVTQYNPFSSCPLPELVLGDMANFWSTQMIKVCQKKFPLKKNGFLAIFVILAKTQKWPKIHFFFWKVEIFLAHLNHLGKPKFCHAPLYKLWEGTGGKGIVLSYWLTELVSDN